MKVVIYGAGNTGFACSVYLKNLGLDPVLITRSEEKARRFQKQMIHSTGLLPGDYKIRVSNHLDELHDADLLIISTEAVVHREIFSIMPKHLSESCKTIVMNGNWAVYEFLSSGGKGKLLESSAQIFIASFRNGELEIKTIKKEVGLASHDLHLTTETISELRDIFPQFKAFDSFLLSSMGNTNPVIHLPVALLNLASIDSGKPFLFYKDGASPLTVEAILKLDEERVAVAGELGYALPGILESINSFFEIKHPSLYDAIHQNKTYQTVKGPTSVRHRYFTEDLAFGICPVASIAHAIDFPCPMTDAVVNYCSFLFGDQLVADAPKFDRESIERFLMRK